MFYKILNQTPHNKIFISLIKFMTQQKKNSRNNEAQQFKRKSTRAIEFL